MKYLVKNKEIHIEIPASNDGRFRFKTRDDNFKFGQSFASRSAIFNEKVYLEWQIGYDVTKQSIKKGEKSTSLTHLTFVGSNGKTKHPYELSELIYKAVQIGFINIGALVNLKKEIDGYDKYLSDKKIDIQSYSHFTLNNLKFKETSIRLPTFFLSNTADGTQIEVSIQKQQYASGVQPMIYFSIPLKSFANGKNLEGRSSKAGDKLVFIIGKRNVDSLLSFFRVFGMASLVHNHDIGEITKVIIGDLK